MALAVQHQALVAVMDGAGESGVVHPFFTASRSRSREPVPQREGDLETEDSANEHANGLKQIRRSRKRSPEKGVQSTLSFARKDVQPAGEQPGSAETEHTPIGLVPPREQEELHPSEGPRKRQRTASVERPATPTPAEPVQPLGWEEQLLQARFGENTPAKTDENRPPTAMSDASVLIVTAPSVPCLDRTSETPESAATKVAEPIAHTPPKKVIKLRTDGRLISPKAKDDGVKKTKGKRKSNEDTEKLGKKLVTLRYGVAPATQASFGKQIEEILSGARTFKNPVSAPVPPPVNSKPSGPPKQTHPFFTGKVPRLKLEAPTILIHDESDMTTSGRERSSSPKKVPAPSRSWAGFGASFAKPQRPVGTIQAIWPPRDMMHCRDSTFASTSAPLSTLSIPQRKLKGAATRVLPSEDVLNPLLSLLSCVTSEHDIHSPSTSKHFHRPTRRLLTGEELRNKVELQDLLLQPRPNDVHPTIRKLRNDIKTSLSAFDKFECENQEWSHKYAPKVIADVLSDDPNLLLLRDWLVGLTVNTVGSASTTLGNTLAKKMKMRAKKKRKISEGLDDFIVSSEDDLGDVDELTDPEDEHDDSSIALPRLSNRNLGRAKAVVLSGPHGCGKTASVYAAAQELGFEVFEINSGTRRSGRDILDRVGDMTRNHLVRQLPDKDDGAPDDRNSPAPDTSAEVDSGSQSTMNSFFKSNGVPKKAGPKIKHSAPKKIAFSPKKPPRKQKQSLILFEEVDVLFDEDRQFWSTVLSLLLSSRRPIVLTCTDETLLPISEMLDVVALRLSPPPEKLVVDYLLLLASNEGHLIARDAMARLVRLHDGDLRQSIVQLNFLCQMALGDTKGGVEWMLIRSNVAESTNAQGESLRVVSEGTFTGGMVALMPDRDASCRGLEEELFLLQDAHANWDLQPEEWLDASLDRTSLRSSSLDSLRRFDVAAEARSAADLFPGADFEPDLIRLDPTAPPLSDKDRSHYPDGLTLLDTPWRSDPSGLSRSLVIALYLLSRTLQQPSAPALTPSYLSSILATRALPLSALSHQHSQSLHRILHPLALPNPTYLGSTPPSRLPATLTRVLATDVAPAVRPIVAADLKLEQERVRLGNLLSQGGQGGRRARTTRAARAALEGGRKESTRRERWFRKEVVYRDVLGTAGEGWEEAREGMVQQQQEDEGKQRRDPGGMDGTAEESVMVEGVVAEGSVDEDAVADEHDDIVGDEET